MLRHWMKILLAMCFLGCGWEANLPQAMSAEPIVVSKETTHLTEPLAGDGLPDYAGALLAELREGVTPENNGAIQYLQAMWPAELMEEHHEAICDELGMPVPTGPGMESPPSSGALRDAVAAWLQPTDEPRDNGPNDAGLLFDLLGQQPWTTDDAPPVAMYLAAFDEQYRLLHEGLEKPCFYLPSPSLLVDPEESWIAMLQPTPQSMRDAARCLKTRANLRTGEGEHEAAWDDLRAIYVMADRLPSTSISEELVSIALESFADQSAQNLLNDPDLSLKLAESMLEFYHRRPPRRGMATVIDVGERRAFLSTILAYAGQRGSGLPQKPSKSIDLPKVNPEHIDWNAVLRLGNAHYDQHVAALQIAEWRERQAAVAEINHQLQRSRRAASWEEIAAVEDTDTRSRKFGEKLMSLILRGILQINRVDDRRNERRQLMSIAAALAVYRCEHGEYPDSLAAVTPDLLPESPTDLFHHAPIAYRRTSRGYLLYSLGPNGRDDEGSNQRELGAYRGYSVRGLSEREDQAIRDLLDALPATGGDDDLEALIPTDADDYAVRMPPAVFPLPRATGE